MTLNLANKRFGRLRVSNRVESRRRRDGRSCRFWLCLCSCGESKWVDASNLTTGNSKSCGQCVKGTHRLSGIAAYRIWANMLSRCRNPNDDGYYLYGGRGIKVCRRWFKFENFYADMGDRPFKKSIERRDVNGDYDPKNCYWATAKAQAQNRRTNKLSLEKAKFIRKLFASGASKTNIARKFDVSLSAIARVIDDSRWIS